MSLPLLFACSVVVIVVIASVLVGSRTRDVLVNQQLFVVSLVRLHSKSKSRTSTKKQKRGLKSSDTQLVSEATEKAFLEDAIENSSDDDFEDPAPVVRVRTKRRSLSKRSGACIDNTDSDSDHNEEADKSAALTATAVAATAAAAAAAALSNADPTPEQQPNKDKLGGGPAVAEQDDLSRPASASDFHAGKSGDVETAQATEEVTGTASGGGDGGDGEDTDSPPSEAGSSVPIECAAGAVSPSPTTESTVEAGPAATEEATPDADVSTASPSAAEEEEEERFVASLPQAAVLPHVGSGSVPTTVRASCSDLAGLAEMADTCSFLDGLQLMGGDDGDDCCGRVDGDVVELEAHLVPQAAAFAESATSLQVSAAVSRWPALGAKYRSGGVGGATPPLSSMCAVADCDAITRKLATSHDDVFDHRQARSRCKQRQLTTRQLYFGISHPYQCSSFARGLPMVRARLTPSCCCPAMVCLPR